MIFIPAGEPWRNAVIDNFQGVFDKTFYRRQFFTSFKHLKQQARSFEKFRNNNHRCSAGHRRTPARRVVSNDIHIRKLDPHVTLAKIDLTLREGCIHFVRFIRSDCQLDVCGEKFKMRQKPKYEYVIAAVCTETHTLQVTLDNEVIQRYEYPMPIEYDRD